MQGFWAAIILGVVQGVTEFLPISSTGHLILTDHLVNFTGPKAETFDIIIQLGSILSVMVIYRDRFIGLVSPAPGMRFAGTRGIYLLMLTSLPASLAGLLFRKTIKAHLFGPHSVALALAVGAVMILVVEAIRRKDKYTSLDDITPGLALGVGLFQCLALWPGFSRSASTIMGGMILGANRRLAAEYSFIAAVPIMFAATGYEFYKSYSILDATDLGILAVGFVTAFLASWVSVKGLIAMLQRFSLRPFAYYRFLVAAAVWMFWPDGASE